MLGHLQLAHSAGDAPVGASDETIRVVLADDHEAMRRNLRRLLDGERGITVIAEADDLASVIRQVHCGHPEVLVLDLSLRGGSSVEAIRRLREHLPATQVVVLKMEESAAFAQHALDAGALGFVLKDTADRELPEAVRRAARSERFVSPRVASRLEARRHALAAGATEGGA